MIKLKVQGLLTGLLILAFIQHVQHKNTTDIKCEVHTSTCYTTLINLILLSPECLIHFLYKYLTHDYDSYASINCCVLNALQSNTYQAIVITNLEQSYAIFTYNCGQLEWSGLDVFATIGYNSPSDGSFANHRFTGLQDTTEIACNPNPVINNVIYQISNIESAAADQRRMCLEWYLSDFDKYEQSDINLLDQFTALPCPCQFFQALFDFRFRFSFAKDSTFCFTERFIFKAAIRECCYGFDTLTFGALVTDTENGGSLLLSPIPDESLQQNNRLPQSLCCSGEVRLCDLYYERRPPNNCAGYVPLWFSK